VQQTFFSGSDFSTAEMVHLNRVAVPCGSDSSSQALPQPLVPSLHTPSLDLLPSVVTHKDYIHFIPPTRTYSKTLVPSAVTPIPIHADSPSTSFQISAVQLSPTEGNTFAVKETAFPLSSLNISASDGELGHINCQSSSSKPRARHSLLKEPNLSSLSELTLRKRKLYGHIWNKESAHCKLKKKYKGKKLEKLYDEDSDPLVEDLSSAFSLEAARFVAGIFRNNRQPKNKRCNFEDKVLALSFLKHSSISYILLCTLLPLPSRRSLQSVLNTVPFRTGINAYVFHAFQHSAENVL
jgi:hypothetical protein